MYVRIHPPPGFSAPPDPSYRPPYTDGGQYIGECACGKPAFGLSGPVSATQAEQKQLKELAKWPAQAQAAWKRLGLFDRNLVLWQMAANYGTDFARSFLNELGKRKPGDTSHTSYFGRGVGPKPSGLRTLGYQLAQKDSVHEWWVHPSGKSVIRNYTDDTPEPAMREVKKTAPRSPRCQEIDVLTDHICENADRICRLAAEVGDEPSRATCERARASSAGARQKSKQCE